jgi:hypothetical protein
MPQQYGQPGYPQQPYAQPGMAVSEAMEGLGNHLPHQHPVLRLHRPFDRLLDLQGPQRAVEDHHTEALNSRFCTARYLISVITISFVIGLILAAGLYCRVDLLHPGHDRGWQARVLQVPHQCEV